MRSDGARNPDPRLVKTNRTKRVSTARTSGIAEDKTLRNDNVYRMKNGLEFHHQAYGGVYINATLILQNHYILSEGDKEELIQFLGRKL